MPARKRKSSNTGRQERRQADKPDLETGGLVEEDSGGNIAKASGNDSLGDMLSQNFLEYASYVIKERAIPDVADGMKPVQRRILHSLWEMDDGRFHKVANVIGHTMRYHPHGDASIGSALVVLANKDYFIDRQGNFGNIFTGDEASAARYIECRLTQLAREVLFNRELTEFVDSYDGRNLEPVRLPAKVPALLMMGADGIAVGMATRIMPHNFTELLKAQIALLKGRRTRLYPDFQTGGIMDVGEYEDGNGRIKVRARIDIVDDKTLHIRDIPATTTTESVMASIIEANRRGKIKVAGVNDYTADRVEIEIKLPRGYHADEGLKQLYAYTDCEVGISCSLTVIRDNRPEIMTVSQILKESTDQLVDILKRELELELGKLEDRFHEKTLAQIFIENRIYKRIEECPTFEEVVGEVHAGLAPFRDQLTRDVTDEDVGKLLQIQIRRISLFDINRNREELKDILARMDEVRQNLAHLTQYAIDYVKGLLKEYGGNYPRRTKIEDLEDISARDVALENVKVGHDRINHFIGSEVRNSNKNEEMLACTEFDRLVLLENSGKYKVVPIPDKLYVGAVKYLLKADRDQVYSMIYRDRKTSKMYVKRFRIASYIMDRQYRCLPKNCIIEAFYKNYGVVVRCEFKHKIAGTDDFVDVSFNDVELRSAGARGFKISDRPIKSITQVRRGSLTPDGPSEDDDETNGDDGGEGGSSSGDKCGDDDGQQGQGESDDFYEPHLDPDMAGLGEAPDETPAGEESEPPKPRAGKAKKKTGSVKSSTKGDKISAQGPSTTAKRQPASESRHTAGPAEDSTSTDHTEADIGSPEPPPKRSIIDEDTPFFLE